MTIKGTKDDDFLRGSSSNDTLKGGRGDDTLRGGEGVDTLIGGKGSDTFVVSVDQFDFIQDFQSGKDRIVLVDPFLSAGDDGIGLHPLPLDNYGDVSVSNGVVEYKGAPVAAIGDADFAYSDFWLS